MAGINRALLNRNQKIIYENKIESKSGKPCVFISHRSSDMEAAEAIAKYLKFNDIDVYLDKLDDELQEKAKEENAKGIVDAINEGLKYSTHILVLISDKTRESWWVPYEVGYSKKGEKKIASALLTGYVEGFPDYLKIERTIESPEEFKDYAKEIRVETLSNSFLAEYVVESVSKPIGLEKYIRRV